MTQVYFPAIVERGEEPGYSVFFPDLPGLASAGDTIQAAARNAETGLRGHLEMMVEAGEPIPDPSELDAIPRDDDIQEAARLLVRAEVPSSRIVRINVTLPEDLIRRIDARADNRSKFLAVAAERALQS
jgi:predicted RNase H-like HicB family nuclease